MSINPENNDLCPNMFVNMCSLKRHKEDIHKRRENEVPICSKCGKAFMRKNCLEKHEKKYTGYKWSKLVLVS